MKKEMKFLALILALMFALSCMSGCANADADKPQTSSAESTTTADAAQSASSSDADVSTVKIAAFYNLSGAGAQAGEYSRAGAQMAVDDINAAGGIQSLGGAKLELVFGDLQSDVNQAKAVAENVLSDGDVSICIGIANSAMAVPILGVTERMNIPFLLNGTSTSLTEEGYTTIFRFCPTGVANGQAQVAFLRALNEEMGLGITKVGSLYENTEGGISNTEGFKAYVEEAGLEWVYEETFTSNGLTDASNLVVKMKDSGVQAFVVTALDQDLKAITEAMNTMDYHPLMIGGGSGILNPSFAIEMGDAVDGIVSSSSGNWDNTDSSDPDVAKRFEEAYGYFMPEHAVGAYTAVQCAAAALEQAGTTDLAALKETMRGLDIVTVDGRVTFDEKGDNPDAITTMVQWQKCEDGQYRTVSVYPASLAAGTLQYDLVN